MILILVNMPRYIDFSFCLYRWCKQLLFWSIMMSFKCFWLEDVPFIVGRFMDVRSLNGKIIVERFLCFVRYLFMEMPSLCYFLRSGFLLVSLLLANLTCHQRGYSENKEFLKDAKSIWSTFDVATFKNRSAVNKFMRILL